MLKEPLGINGLKFKEAQADSLPFLFFPRSKSDQGYIVRIYSKNIQNKDIM